MFGHVWSSLNKEATAYCISHFTLTTGVTRRLLRRTFRLQVTKHTQGGKMRVGVVYAAVQDGYLVFPLNVVQRCFRGYLVTDTS